jgi:hypothetical protein
MFKVPLLDPYYKKVLFTSSKEGKSHVTPPPPLSKPLKDPFYGQSSATTLAKKAGLVLDPWQIKLVESKAPRQLLCCSRQVGKSTVTGLLALFTAISVKNALILLVSPSERQSQELFKKVLSIYVAAGKPVAPKIENKLSLELVNGSRIHALPGNPDTIRGFSGVTLLVIDEAAQVPDQLVHSVRPMLAVSKGRLVVLSTPFGQRGWFYEACRMNHLWDYYEIKATECPRISQDFLDGELKQMGKWWYDQEYDCVFNDACGAAFRTSDIERIVKENVTSWEIIPERDPLILLCM